MVFFQLDQLSQQIQHHSPVMSCIFFDFDWALVFSVSKTLAIQSLPYIYCTIFQLILDGLRHGHIPHYLNYSWKSDHANHT